ncbi:aspartic proteinase 36-like [Impatiens glandulifera]|uniref:aspartic proteinase 36-like n=1 Tax=Impatiens glandulifera TaxID=253017 RepID=UPI001FB066B6|nr:aspartic proteinase 36-like [Impatiens glandulifera]
MIATPSFFSPNRMARSSSSSSSSSFCLPYFLFLFTITSFSTPIASPVGFGGVLSVKYKFSGTDRSLSALKAHDDLRNIRMASGVDIPLGGSGRPDAVGLYYAKVGIGTPPKDYYVQVDTGSDIMWVNCILCKECPQTGYHGIPLTLYDLKNSLTGTKVFCDSQFCIEINAGRTPDCAANVTCLYTEVYGDGSYSLGYFVKDLVQYDGVSGDLQTMTANQSFIFGCGASQSGDLDSSEHALDGIVGFGKSNSSFISQLAASGTVKKIFAHCLDGVNGGGIFAIGHVVQPKVNTTRLLPNKPHYNVNMTAVQVGSEFLNLTTNVSHAGDYKETIIDSGTTLAYFPDAIYQALVKKILWQLDIKLQTLHEQYTCFQHPGSVDDDFPAVTFHFENSVLLKVYPHEYLFLFEGLWCLGWQSNGVQPRDKQDIILLGDLVLSNKLVLYDLEKHVIGWTEYNCSSSIEIMDEVTGSVHLVGAHSLPSSACDLTIMWLLLVAGFVNFALGEMVL